MSTTTFFFTSENNDNVKTNEELNLKNDINTSSEEAKLFGIVQNLTENIVLNFTLDMKANHSLKCDRLNTSTNFPLVIDIPFKSFEMISPESQKTEISSGYSLSVNTDKHISAFNNQSSTIKESKKQFSNILVKSEKDVDDGFEVMWL